MEPQRKPAVLKRWRILLLVIRTAQNVLNVQNILMFKMSLGERSSDSIFAATTRRGGEDMIGFKLSPCTITSASG